MNEETGTYETDRFEVTCAWLLVERTLEQTPVPTLLCISIVLGHLIVEKLNWRNLVEC